MAAAAAANLPENQPHHETKRRKKKKEINKKTHQNKNPPPASSPPAKPPPSSSPSPSPAPATAALPHKSSWKHLKSLVTCKHVEILNPPPPPSFSSSSSSSRMNTKLISSCGSSICAVRDVVHVNNTRVVSRSSDSSGGSSPGATDIAATKPPDGGGALPLLRFSGCYECRTIAVDPVSRRYPRPRTMSRCTECGEVFTKPESLEMHRALRHAVTELGPEDSGRNIVEIIFKSSWQKKDGATTVKIERILRVHNAARTISRFEDCRAAVKARAAAARHHHHRCAADGNELLRFHSAPISCRLGADGSLALCAGGADCGVCAVIRSGFSRGPRGVRTTASSGGAHGLDAASEPTPRAMLVCRVIAGRVRRSGEDPVATEEAGGGGAATYDSVAGGGDGFADLEELFVANPRAILPCFVVIYRVLD